MSDDTSGIALTRRRLLAGLGALGAAGAASGAGTFAYFRDTGTSNGNTVEAGTLKLNIHDGGNIHWNSAEMAPGNKTKIQDVFFENVGSVAASSLSMSFSNTEREHNGSAPNSLTYANHTVNESALTPGPESDTNTSTTTGPNGSDLGALGMAKWVRVWNMTYDPDTTNNVNNNGVKLVDGGQWQSVASKYGLTEPDHSNSHPNDWISLQDLANASPLSGFGPPESGNTPDNYNTGSGPTQTNLQLQLKLADETPNKYQGDVVFTDISFTLNQ